MSIKYICRHCRTLLGELKGGFISENMLGLQFLTPEERSDIITYNANGDMTVRVVCDYCREAIDTHPELSLLVSPLQ